MKMCMDYNAAFKTANKQSELCGAISYKDYPTQKCVLPKGHSGKHWFEVKK